MSTFESLLQADRGQPARTIHLTDPRHFDTWLSAQPPRVRAAAQGQKLKGAANSVAILPGEQPEDWFAVGVVANVERLTPWCLAKLAETLPEGSYRIEGRDPGAAAYGWLMAQYRFTRYRKDDKAQGPRVLLTGDPARMAEHVLLADVTAKVRDLVNTGASDMGPAELESAAEALAKTHGATLTVTRGDQLARGYPMIHAVGKAAGKGREPRLIELEWGDPAHPRVAIVGKGVCFDSGGLDIKPSSGMRLMKKDMGGAAHALGLAEMVMASKLPVRLHMLVPAVENAVSGESYRPGDVLATRKGLTVENSNTDAEGRLILGDALTRAGEGNPQLILDYATLTGAARVALGADLTALFANDDALAEDLLRAAEEVQDPAWRMPLWDGYDDMLKSDIADMVNAAEGTPFGGAITAALFLRRFIPEGTPWAHHDIFCWHQANKPGRPKGADAVSLRATWKMLKDRFAA